jgi:hypothetical protein
VPKISTWLLRQQNNERALTMEYIETRSQIRSREVRFVSTGEKVEKDRLAHKEYICMRVSSAPLKTENLSLSSVIHIYQEGVCTKREE